MTPVPSIADDCLVCVDVDYREAGAVAALVAFDDWADAAPRGERTEAIAHVAPYVPGEFYRRELPCLLRVLQGLVPRAVVVDGYVWLARDRPGLGAHLHEALGRRCPVIGVSKTAFAGADLAVEVRRGTSCRPLYVTAAGMDAAEAADRIRRMHGAHRIPTLLKRVDQRCRGRGPGASGPASPR